MKKKMMMSKKIKYCFFVFSFVLFFACSTESKKLNNNSSSVVKKVDTVLMLCEASFRPIIEDMLPVFHDTYKSSYIIPYYETQTQAVNKFLSDSNYRILFSSKIFNSEEVRSIEDNQLKALSQNHVAYDGVALIVNNNFADSAAYSFEKLKLTLEGKNPNVKNVIFDGMKSNANSIYIQDSVLDGKQYDTSVVKGAGSSKDVIEMVKKRNDIIGVVSSMWVNNSNKSKQVQLRKTIKMLPIKCKTCRNPNYFTATLFSILSKDYPLRRNLIVATKDNGFGAASNFAGFLKSEQGQLAFKAGYVGPAIMGFAHRQMHIIRD